MTDTATDSGSGNDSGLGNRDRRGDWRPPYLVNLPVIFAWPPKPWAALKWTFGFPGYLWPWNAVYLSIAVMSWFFLTPPLAEMQSLELWWIAIVWGRNMAFTVVLFGGLHLWLFTFKRQGIAYKYSTRPLAKDNKIFTFGNQTWDNVFWSLAGAVTVWTVYEVLTLWAYANDWLPYIDWETNPVWFVVFLMLIPAYREMHFYVIHRILHWKPLYDRFHELHHRNVIVGPWSGLSQHPVESIAYFSCVLLHFVVPSHPIHAMFTLHQAALTPAVGHLGFDRIVVRGGGEVPVNNYFHYLHHKYLECNYSGDGMPLLDKVFGTYHNGSDADHVRTEQRLAERAAARLRA